MDIRVGDKITLDCMGDVKTIIITTEQQIEQIKENVTTYTNKILKIERPYYEVVEEKKELLTEEEKEFLKDMCKYYHINNIYFDDNYVSLRENDTPQLSPWYPENIKFANVEKYRKYTLQELGLEDK